MKKLYYQDTHIIDFEAVVTDCIPDEEGKGYYIVLDKTAFFPEGGGQAADRGTFNHRPVLDVQIKDDVVYHLTSIPYEVGQRISGHVDWDRRFDYMQQHTGEHIISGLLHKHYGFNNVGFHLGVTEVTLDFDGQLSMEQLREIEREANEIVWKNLPVNATFPTEEILAEMDYRSKIEIEGAVRIVEIPGVDVCACCAPHVEKTGEIGIIKIQSASNHRGGMRLHILCGARALHNYSWQQDICHELSVLLSAMPGRIVDAVKKLLDDAVQFKVAHRQLASQLLQLQLDTLPAPEICKNPILFDDLSDTVAIRNTVNKLTGKYSGYCAAFSGDDTNGYSFIIGSSTLDCRPIATMLRENLGAKGGGTALMIQGNVQATRAQLEAFFSAL